jgi:predicted PurR-regulated permease PerM
MYFLYRDGERLHAFLLEWSPLPDEFDESILTKLSNAISSLLKGTLTTAVIQGSLVGIGFAIFGVPNPILWGGVATIAALVPIVEANIIAVPGALILVLGGHTIPGIGLFLWSFFSIGLVDNFFRPMLIKRGMNVHPFLVLLSVLGGLAYFGPIGFLAGPVVIAFLFTLLDVYPLIIKGSEHASRS